MKTAPVPIRVLVVEDHAAYRRALASLLELEPGIQCAGECRTAEQAMERLHDTSAHVALLDINLPRASGIDCARAIRKCHEAIDIVMLTVEHDVRHVFEALCAGAVGYLLKPATGTEIVEAIRLAASGGSPMSAEIARLVVDYFRHAPAPSPLPKLSAQETRVIEHLANGLRLKEIATELGIELSTAQTYIRRIYEKLQVHSQAEAVAKYLASKRNRRVPSRQDK